MKSFSEILKPEGMLNGTSSGQIGNPVWVRVALNGFMFAFLGGNLFYRLSTIFDYSIFIKCLFLFLGVCSLFVILFPGYLRAYLFFFGASFFLFGFRGYDIQSQVFETVVVFVVLTVFFVNLRRKNGAGLNRQLVGLILCYIGLSVLSLQLLPLGHIVKDFWLFGLKTSFLQVANATPNTFLYPLAGINRLILYFVFVLEVSRGKEARELFKWIFVGIFVGGVFCAFVGLLDYYGVISLKWYSHTVTGYTLSSTFLNRGWLAEFILMMAPFVLIGFMSKIKGVWWKILLLGSLVVCEIALILAGARAGWVSYPLILFICWLFFYFSKEGRLESFHFRWRDLAKVAVSVPITIGISFLLIFQVFMPFTDYLAKERTLKGISGNTKAKTAYLETRVARLTEISKGGRLYTWGEGFAVGRERPVFGMGYESFNWHANILADMPESHFHRFYTEAKINKIHDTPHNVFFQLFVSGGVVGLCLWMMIVFYAMVILIVDLIRSKRLLNVPVIISIISFHIYGIFQSMQYIPMIWMFIFLNLGYAMTIDKNILPDRIKRLTGVVLKVMIFLVLIGGVAYFTDRGSQGLAEKYGLMVYAKDQDWHNYHGFYHREKWGKEYYRWSGPRAVVKVDGSGIVAFNIQCHTPGVEKNPVEVIISLDGERIDEVCFDKKGGIKRPYYVGKKVDGEGHTFLFEVSRTWNPKKLGISADGRDLGVAVSEPRFLKKMPKDGVGF